MADFQDFYSRCTRDTVLLAAERNGLFRGHAVCPLNAPGETPLTDRDRHKGLEINSILAAVRWGCDIPMFDFLLGKKVSPMETDYRGFVPEYDMEVTIR